MKHYPAILLLFLLFPSFLQSQNISGIINKYAAITVMDTCAGQVTVDDITGFAVGDRIIVMQMKGANISQDNNSNFGDITNLRAVGQYEINQIDSISGKIIFFKYKLLNAYFNTGGVCQMVSFPKYQTVTIVDTIKAKAWDGASGGIIAFEANSLVINAPIDASKVGFRGGYIKTYNQCDGGFTNYGNYFYNLNSTSVDNGGLKGEGVAMVIAGKECGRGAQANGGGGGNNHKSGGGGGANIASGGQGGENERENILRCPGGNPGRGGKGLSSTNINQLFLGGGGGSGHNKEGTDTRGGNGGGIVLIKANSISGTKKIILANGGSAVYNSGDGAGGGGAGGTVVVESKQIIGQLSVTAKGGNGGGAADAAGYDLGPGGGGGGGRIIADATLTIDAVLTGGSAGINDGTRSTQKGANGDNGNTQKITNLKMPVATDTIDRFFSIDNQPKAVLTCEGKTAKLSIEAKGLNLKYQWQVNSGSGFVNLNDAAPYSGVKTDTLTVSNTSSALNPNAYRCVVSSGCGVPRVINSTETSLNVKPLPLPIFTFTKENNTIKFNNGSSNSDSYFWTFGNGKSDTTRSPIHTYAEQDTYRVTLKATNVCGTKEYTDLLNLNTPPKSNFEASTQTNCAPALVRFTNLSSDNSKKYYWSFPKGRPLVSTDKTPSVTYDSSGVYDVILVVENGFGRDTFLRKEYIKVNDKPKVAFTVTPTNLNVSIMNKTTNATSYKWEFGDGKTSTEANPNYTYFAGGTYIIKLTALNACGSITDTQRITLFSLPSAAINTSTTQGCAPFSVQYTGKNVSGVTTWSWSFPGGTPSVSSLPNPRVVYDKAGDYDVTLSITNSAGTSSIKQDTLIKVLPTPKAIFEFKVTDNVVEFFNKSTNADKYIWNFGNGKTSDLRNPPPLTFRVNGNYDVTLLAQNTACASVVSRQVPIFFLTPTNDLNTEGGIKLYPNPTEGMLYVDLKEAQSLDFQVIISNIQGEIFKQYKIAKNAIQALDMNDLPQGVFFLTFKNGKKQWVRKVVKL